jgi:acetyl esterase/lipase
VDFCFGQAHIHRVTGASKVKFLAWAGGVSVFLSNTVRVHRKMRAAGVDAELEVFEGQSHAPYQADPFAPETKEYFAEVTRFLDSHLVK